MKSLIETYWEPVTVAKLLIMTICSYVGTKGIPIAEYLFIFKVAVMGNYIILPICYILVRFTLDLKVRF